MVTLGLDGYPRGWVAAVMADGQLAELATVRSIEDALARWPAVAAVGVDIPMGLPDGLAPRAADLEARALLGRRAGTLFLTPPRAVIEAPTHEQAVRVAGELGCGAPSRQLYALRGKILETAPIAARDDRLIEVHPELAFRMLHRAPLGASKRSWDGFHERLHVLRAAGIELPPRFPGGAAPAPDDVLDAAVCALVAARYAGGRAVCLPTRPAGEPRLHRIWYTV
jgi:predicted RNase H-like nuclease